MCCYCMEWFFHIFLFIQTQRNTQSQSQTGLSQSDFTLPPLWLNSCSDLLDTEDNAFIKSESNRLQILIGSLNSLQHKRRVGLKQLGPERLGLASWRSQTFLSAPCNSSPSPGLPWFHLVFCWRPLTRSFSSETGAWSWKPVLSCLWIHIQQLLLINGLLMQLANEKTDIELQRKHLFTCCYD